MFLFNILNDNNLHTRRKKRFIILSCKIGIPETKFKYITYYNLTIIYLYIITQYNITFVLKM